MDIDELNDVSPEEHAREMASSMVLGGHVGDDTLERQFRREHPVLRGATLFGPIIVTLLLLLLIGTVDGWDELRRLVMMAFASMWVSSGGSSFRGEPIPKWLRWPAPSVRLSCS